MACTKRKQSSLTGFLSESSAAKYKARDPSVAIARTTSGLHQTTESDQLATEGETDHVELDIADFAADSLAVTPDAVKWRLINERRPLEYEKLPTRTYKDSKRKSGVYQRNCNREWFDVFPFLSYSRRASGLYCLACVLFPASGPVNSREGACRANFLVKKPYQNWKDAKVDLTAHASVHYHQLSEARLRAFIATMENPSQRVDFAINLEAQQLVKRNRAVLTSIVKCLELCGRHGISLRGHRDDSTCDVINKGKFLALVQFRIDSGDAVLKEFLEKQCAKNATYISKTSQNDLLECMGDYILGKILSDVKASKFFGLEADEVTDLSGWEQLGLVLRYVKDNQPVETLVSFIACENVRGASICDKLFEALSGFGIDRNLCRAQAYDGAGSMAGHLNGCQAKFRERVPRAAYYHCGSHQLNLAISKSSTVPEIQCMLSYLKAVGIFFKYSPKRQRHLETAVSNVNVQRKALGVPEVSPHKVKLMCETRWVERHTVLAEFSEMYEPIVNCFETISRNSSCQWNAKSVTEANGLLKAISSDRFIAAFQTNLYFFGYTKPLSCLLQGSTQDILTAYKEVDVVKSVLKDIRANPSKEYDKFYASMCTMAKLHGMDELTVPRTCSRQTLRSNIEVENPKVYWRCTTFIPFLDHLIAELSTRFSQLNQQAIQGLQLLPCNLTTLTDDKVAELYERFHQDLPAPEAFQQEVKVWTERWKLFSTPLPDNICETLQQANDKLYPNICSLLKLLLVIPVTTASVERGNSSLKYVKSELRTTMTQDRLNALILLSIHKDIPLDYDVIVNAFAAKRPRRMLLQSPLLDPDEN